MTQKGEALPGSGGIRFGDPKSQMRAGQKDLHLLDPLTRALPMIHT